MSSGFVTEAELEEKRRIRQEEWEKVRQADQPEEVPDEPFDHRSLFDRLEEQKQKKQMEFEEAHKLKNMIKGLDDDEVEFLDFVDQKKIEAEQLKEQEERKELQEFRMHVEKLKENYIDEKIQAEMRKRPMGQSSVSSTNVKSQQKLLQGVVVKRKIVGSHDATPTKVVRQSTSHERSDSLSSPECDANGKRKLETPSPPPTIMCVGILPGLGNYSPSSDSDSSSSANEPEHRRTKYDLLGRKLELAAKKPAS